MKNDLSLAFLLSFAIHLIGLYTIAHIDLHVSGRQGENKLEMLKVAIVNLEDKEKKVPQVSKRSSAKIVQTKSILEVKRPPEYRATPTIISSGPLFGDEEGHNDTKGSDDIKPQATEPKSGSYSPPETSQSDADKEGHPEVYMLHTAGREDPGNGGSSIRESRLSPPLNYGSGGTTTDPSPSAGSGQGSNNRAEGMLARSSSSHHSQKGLLRSGPKYHINPKPPYPSYARERGFEGVTLLHVEVLENGKVGRISVERSSGYSILDEAALQTVKGWQFEPAREGDKPIAMWVRIPIRFELR